MNIVCVEVTTDGAKGEEGAKEKDGKEDFTEGMVAGADDAAQAAVTLADAIYDQARSKPLSPSSSPIL